MKEFILIVVLSSSNYSKTYESMAIFKNAYECDKAGKRIVSLPIVSKYFENAGYTCIERKTDYGNTRSTDRKQICPLCRELRI